MGVGLLYCGMIWLYGCLCIVFVVVCFDLCVGWVVVVWVVVVWFVVCVVVDGRVGGFFGCFFRYVLRLRRSD